MLMFAAFVTPALFAADSSDTASISLDLQPEVEVDARTPRILIVGAGYLPDYPGSNDQRLVPMLISRAWLGGVRFEFDGTEARFDLATNPLLRAGPLFNIGLPREDVVSETVATLPTLEPVFEAGGYIGFETLYGPYREGALSGFLSLRTDVDSGRQGSVLRGNLEYFFAAARALRFSLSLDVNLADQSHMQTWFGVDPTASSVSGLNVYTPSGGLRDVGVSLNTLLSLSPSLGIYSRLNYTRLSAVAADSPLVREEGTPQQWFAGIGMFLTY